ncbi:hypothetical protein L9F63_027962, partial [Diploptera punctata]
IFWFGLLFKLQLFNGNYDAVKVLLAEGANPNLGDEFSNVKTKSKETGFPTPVIYATREAEFNDRLNHRSTYYGFTALHYAVLADRIEIVRILLENGANPTIENSSGHRPLDYSHDEDIKDLILEYTTKFDELLRQKEAEERRKFSIRSENYTSPHWGNKVPSQ